MANHLSKQQISANERSLQTSKSNVFTKMVYTRRFKNKSNGLNVRIFSTNQWRAGRGAAAPLRVKYEGRQNGNLKHMGAEGALVEMQAK